MNRVIFKETFQTCWFLAFEYQDLLLFSVSRHCVLNILGMFDCCCTFTLLFDFYMWKSLVWMEGRRKVFFFFSRVSLYCGCSGSDASDKG